MQLTITMDRGNAAFGNDDEDDTSTDARDNETARIVRKIADHIAAGYESGKCVDYNGNTVGTWAISLTAQEQNDESED